MFPWLRKKGVKFPEKISSDHETLARMMHEVGAFQLNVRIDE